MGVVAELSVVPLGAGPSVGELVAEAVKALREAGIRLQVTPMCTVFEAGTAEEAFEAALRAHEALFKAGAVRVVTTLRLDERRDVEHSMERKLASLEARLKGT